MARPVGGRLRCSASVDGCRFVRVDDFGVPRCVESCALISEAPNAQGLLECVDSCPGFRRLVSTGVYRCASVCGAAEMLDESTGECVGVCPRGTRADG